MRLEASKICYNVISMDLTNTCRAYFFFNMCTLLFHITLIIMDYHVHLERTERLLFSQSF
jgi:hypothetical protein